MWGEELARELFLKILFVFKNKNYFQVLKNIFDKLMIKTNFLKLAWKYDVLFFYNIY